MLKCLNCDSKFDEPKRIREYRGECFGFPSYETLYVCPFCDGEYTEIEETEENADI